MNERRLQSVLLSEAWRKAAKQMSPDVEMT